MICMVVLMLLMTGSWDLMDVGLFRYGGALQGDSGFSGIFWSRFMEAYKKEEVERVIKVAMMAVVAGVVHSAGVKATCPGVFVEVSRYRQRFMEVYRSIIDKM